MERPFSRMDGVVTLHLRLTPKGGRDSLDGFGLAADGRAHALARVRAVPEDGAANAALTVLLAKTFGVKKSAIEVVAGHTSRLKTLKIVDHDALVTAALESAWQKAALG
jgi:uncharacterized protein